MAEAKHLRLESTETTILFEHRLNTSRKRAPRLLELIYRTLTEMRCPMFDAMVGWENSQTEWCVLVRLIEPRNADASWLQEARERFADLPAIFDADAEGSYVVKKKGRPFDPAVMNNGHWRYVSKIAAYHASPFLLVQNGRRQAADELAWMSLMSWLAKGCPDFRAKQDEVRSSQRRGEVLPRLNPTAIQEPDMPAILEEDKLTMTGRINDHFFNLETAEEEAADLSDFLLNEIECENFTILIEYSVEQGWVASVELLHSEAAWPQWISVIRTKLFTKYNGNDVSILKHTGLPAGGAIAGNISQAVQVRASRGVLPQDVTYILSSTSPKWR